MRSKKTPGPMGWDFFLCDSNKESLLRLKVKVPFPLTVTGYVSAVVTGATVGSLLLAGVSSLQFQPWLHCSVAPLPALIVSAILFL